MGAPRAGATDLQPADARYPGSPLRLEQGRYGEQAYAESKNRHPDPHTRSIHLHGMSSGPAADCVRVVSAALMTYSITRSARTRSEGGIVSPSGISEIGRCFFPLALPKGPRDAPSPFSPLATHHTGRVHDAARQTPYRPKLLSWYSE